MKTIGSHPGAILFRMSVFVILVAILILVFLIYIDDARGGLERNAIQQTRRVIDSSLALVFTNYAVNGQMSRLNDVDGGNPFVLLRELEIQVADYQGELGHDLTAEQPPGWYYLYKRGVVAYKSHFMDSDSYFRVSLRFQDNNASGRFEYGVDRFENLSFVKVAEIEH